jgi:hypothetical protein
MATQFTWTIVDLERYTKDGVVYNAHYTVNADDGCYQASVYGSIGLTPPSTDNLIPFDQLTEELVIDWVKRHFGSDKVSEIEGNLQARIDEQHQPATAAGLPWQFGNPEPAPVQDDVITPESLDPGDVEEVSDSPVEPLIVDAPADTVVETEVLSEEEEEDLGYSGETVLIRARNELGQYIADDGTTEGHNEAWIEVPIEEA